VWSLLPVVACVPSGNENSNSNPDCLTLEHSSQFPEGFIDACFLEFDDNDQAMVVGEIESSLDVDVYYVGPLSMGDQIEVTCAATSDSNLDPMIALFDSNGYMVFWNDDTGRAPGQYNSSFEGIVHHDSDDYFLGVANSNMAYTSGTYELNVHLQPSSGLASLRGQTVVLNWEAAEDISVSGENFGDMGDFAAETVDDSFEGRTEELKDLIVQIVTDDYAPYEVNVLTTDDPQPDENYTTVYYSDGPGEALFGLADEVDFYNVLDTDNAIIFLRAYLDLSTSLEQIAQGIANVTSHEIGHTLGLMHTTDVTTLMDTTGEDDTLLVDQSFGIAEMYDFPIGWQNAPMLLEETVGERAPNIHHRWCLRNEQYRCGTCGATLSQIMGLSQD